MIPIFVIDNFIPVDENIFAFSFFQKNNFYIPHGVIILILTNVMLICLEPNTFLSSFDFEMDNLIFLLYFLLS